MMKTESSSPKLAPLTTIPCRGFHDPMYQIPSLKRTDIEVSKAIISVLKMKKLAWETGKKTVMGEGL